MVHQHALDAWGDVELRERLSGGNRNEVYLAILRGRPVVVRRSARAPSSLDWELDLLDHLAAAGIDVPSLVPTADGRRHVDGIVVQQFVPGSPPSSHEDWELVVRTLRAVHLSTDGWGQRPGFASSRELRTRDRGGDVRLDRMPAPVAIQVRRAWSAVDHGPQTVVHGDPGPANICIDDGRVTLLDWDEARVDVPWFDLAFLPAPVPLPDGTLLDDVIRAAIAWEVAACWEAEPEYARARHGQLVQRSRAAP